MGEMGRVAGGRDGERGGKYAKINLTSNINMLIQQIHLNMSPCLSWQLLHLRQNIRQPAAIERCMAKSLGVSRQKARWAL